jgi:hypothetical protein
MKLPFKKVYCFRPGYIHPTPGLKNTLPMYKWIAWMYPALRILTPSSVSTLKEVGLAMIHAAQRDHPKSILDVRDIVAMAKE